MNRYVQLALTGLILTLLCFVAGSCIKVVVPTQEQGSSTPVINVFEANPSDIAAGTASTIRWDVSNATSVIIDQNIGTVTLAGSTSVLPNATTNYTLTATNAIGSVTATTQVRVSGTSPSPAATTLPIINLLTATPTAISAGSSSQLGWNVTNATSVNISPMVGAVGATGSTSVSPSTTTTYTLTATNTIGSVMATTQVQVSGTSPSPVATALPIINLFTATPTAISAGSSSQLSWNVTNATSVNISPTVGAVGDSGNAYVSPASTTNYTMTASNATGITVATIQIAVSATSPSPPLSGLPTIHSFIANPESIMIGGSSILSWSVSNAYSVAITQLGTVDAVGSMSVWPSATTAYTLTAINDVGWRSMTITVAVYSQPSPSPQLNWSGTWSTTYNKMYLTQTGNNVTGTYEYDGGKIEGTVSGNVLTGIWSEAPTYALPDDAGTFQFIMSPDYNSFTGKWRHGLSGELDHSWSGTRITP